MPLWFLYLKIKIIIAGFLNRKKFGVKLFTNDCLKFDWSGYHFYSC